MSNTVGKAAVRCKAIGMAELAAMEKHGKRLDESSAKRVIRDASPLVHGSLDLRDRYDAHMDGIRQNAKATKPVLHFIVSLPSELLEGPKMGRFEGSKTDRQKMMLAQAVKFVNDTHGGSAVFAARVDRDELGESIIDVFASPKYEKRTKRTPADEAGVMWASATRFGKELAEKHEDEIRRRHPEAKAGRLTAPRMVGIALQSDFASWFQRVNGVALSPKVEKGTSAPDRIEKEAHDRIEAHKAEMIEEVKVSARRITHDSEERAVSMVRGAKMVAKDILAEAAAEKDQVEVDRKILHQDRADFEVEKAAFQDDVRSLRQQLRDALTEVVRWIRRGDLSSEDKIKATQLVRDHHQLVSPSEKPRPDADRDDGPTF